MEKIKLLFVIAFFAFSVSMSAQPVLGMTTFFTNTTTAINPNTACSITKTCTLSGWLFSIASTSNCGQNWTNSTGGDGRFQSLVGFGTLTQITFGSDDGSEFALKNLTWGVSTSSWTTKPMTFVGYKNGLPVSGATLNATTPAGTGITNTIVVTFTANPAFNDVDDIRLATSTGTCSSILFFEDITVGTASVACITPTLSLTGNTNVLCNGGSTGSATMSASGGSPFTYTWSPSGGNAAIATGLSAGLYTCVTTNSCGSIASRTVNISQPPTLASFTAATSPLCNGNNGSATVTASGGTAPYTYTWSSGPTSSVEPTLLAGTYTVKVIDANGCNITKSVTVTQPSAIATATAVTNVLCFGNSTGGSTVIASGGAGSFTYLWSGAQTTSVISGQTSGVKTVTVTDANSCTKVATVTINQPVSALATATAVANVLCFGNSTGAATVTASGGTSPYSYAWSGAQTTSVISGQTSGVKTVTVTDANSCVKVATVSISQPNALTLTAVANNPSVCAGNSSTLTANGSGGTGVISYSWTSGPTNSINVVSPTANSIYTINISDVNNCNKSQTVSVNAVALPTVSVNSGAICFGNSFTIVPTGASTYTISGGLSVVTPTSNASYNITGTNAQGCVSSNTAVSSITVNALPVISVTSVTICAGATGTLTASGAATYTWSTGSNASSISASPVTTTTYTLNGTSTAGCVGSAVTATISVGSAPSIVVNNATVCAGNSATLNASGVNSYTWNTGSNSASIVVTPTASTTYSVSGNLTGCSVGANTTASVAVNALPSVTAVSNASLICVGQTASLTASGANTYSWSTGGTASIEAVSPTVTTSYTVNGTDANGCNNFTTITQSVSACTGLQTTNYDQLAAINVYPNPANGMINVELEILNEKPAHITITNTLGQVLMSENVNIQHSAFDISNFPSGLYILKAESNGQIKTVRLIKE